MASRSTTGNSQPGSDQIEPDDGSSRNGKFVMLAILALFLVAGVGVVVAVLTLRSGSGDAVTANGAKVEDPPKPDNAVDETTTTTTGDDTTGQPSTTAGNGTDNGASSMEGAATTPVSVPWSDSPKAALKSIRVASHEGSDRVVFEFDGAMPGYLVQYVPGPLTEDPSDNPIALKGDKILLVTMSQASMTKEGADGAYEMVYNGPNRIDGPGNSVAELVDAGDFEGMLTWAIGTNGERPFKVTTLESPTRLVIDVKD